MPARERRAAGAAHGILYLLLVGLPLTGWAVVSLSPIHIPTVLYDLVLPQKDWFDVGKSPQARYEATRFVDKGKGDYEAIGTLEIRGTTRDAVLPFHLQTAGDQAHAKGHLDLVRTSFGVGQGAWAKGQWVALEVGVDVDLIATRVP